MGSQSEKTAWTTNGPRANARQPKSLRQRGDEAIVTLNLPKRNVGRPKRERIGGRQPLNWPAFTHANPVDSAALKLRKTSTRNGVTPRPLSAWSMAEQAAKPQPTSATGRSTPPAGRQAGDGERWSQKRMPGVTPRICRRRPRRKE